MLLTLGEFLNKDATKYENNFGMEPHKQIHT